MSNKLLFTPEEMKQIIDSYVPFDRLKKDAGIYEFYEEGVLSIGISRESLEKMPGVIYPDVYVFNLFADGEYVNIAGEFQRSEDGSLVAADDSREDLYTLLSDSWNQYAEQLLCQYKCKTCGDIIEDDEESLWGHLQMEHEDIFEECQNWETPWMIEEYYEKITPRIMDIKQNSVHKPLDEQIQSAVLRSGSHQNASQDIQRLSDPSR